MRKFLLAAAAASLIAAPVAAGELRGAQSTEFSSQVEVGPDGVRIGPRERYRDRRDRWRDREVRGDRRDGCRTVTVRETLPDGTRVKRTRSSC
jgi:hypothetical protein